MLKYITGFLLHVKELRLLSVLCVANRAGWEGSRVSLMCNDTFTYNVEESLPLGISHIIKNNRTLALLTLNIKPKVVLSMYSFLQYFSISYLSKKE